MGKREKLTRSSGHETSDPALLHCNHLGLVQCTFISNGFESLSLLNNQVGTADFLDEKQMFLRKKPRKNPLWGYHDLDDTLDMFKIKK